MEPATTTIYTLAAFQLDHKDEDSPEIRVRKERLNALSYKALAISEQGLGALACTIVGIVVIPFIGIAALYHALIRQDRGTARMLITEALPCAGRVVAALAFNVLTLGYGISALCAYKEFHKPPVPTKSLVLEGDAAPSPSDSSSDATDVVAPLESPRAEDGEMREILLAGPTMVAGAIAAWAALGVHRPDTLGPCAAPLLPSPVPTPQPSPRAASEPRPVQTVSPHIGPASPPASPHTSLSQETRGLSPQAAASSIVAPLGVPFSVTQEYHSAVRQAIELGLTICEKRARRTSLLFLGNDVKALLKASEITKKYPRWETLALMMYCLKENSALQGRFQVVRKSDRTQYSNIIGTTAQKIRAKKEEELQARRRKVSKQEADALSLRNVHLSPLTLFPIVWGAIQGAMKTPPIGKGFSEWELGCFGMIADLQTYYSSHPPEQHSENLQMFFPFLPQGNFSELTECASALQECSLDERESLAPLHRIFDIVLKAQYDEVPYTIQKQRA